MSRLSWKWILLVWLSGASSAWGYQLQRVESGNFVRWRKDVIRYRIHHAVSQDIDKQRAVQALQESFHTWQKATHDKVQFHFDGFSQNSPGYNSKQPERNENLLSWEEKEWSHNPDAIAMTFVTYKEKSGEIVDADIVFNGVSYQWMIKTQNASDPHHPSLAHKPTKTHTPLPQIDLANTATHEVGHFLGIGHSHNTDATMFAEQSAGEISKRHLHIDDQNAVAALYAVPLQVQVQPPLPPPPTAGLGCDIHNHSHHNPSSWLLWACLGLFFGLGLVRTNRKR